MYLSFEFKVRIEKKKYLNSDFKLTCGPNPLPWKCIFFVCFERFTSSEQIGLGLSATARLGLKSNQDTDYCIVAFGIFIGNVENYKKYRILPTIFFCRT